MDFGVGRGAGGANVFYSGIVIGLVGVRLNFQAFCMCDFIYTHTHERGWNFINELLNATCYSSSESMPFLSFFYYYLFRQDGYCRITASL